MKNLAWKQITAGLVIGFLLGGLFGLWQTKSSYKHWMWKSPEQKKERLLNKYTNRLKLDENQQAEVEQILDASLKQMGDLKAELRPKYKAAWKDLKARIRAVLNETQVEEFNKMEAEWQARKKHWPSDSKPSPSG